jgi:hypothetical protein
MRVTSWSNDLVVRQSPVGKNVSTGTEDIAGIHHQATTGVDVENWEGLVRLSWLFVVTFCKCSINPIIHLAPSIVTLKSWEHFALCK